MSNKTILSVMIGLIAFVIIFFIASGIIKSINKNKNNVTYYDEYVQKKVETIEQGEVSGKYSSTEYTPEYLNLTQEERNAVDTAIDYILELIEKQDVEAIEKLLTSQYKYARFRIPGSLKEYLEEKFSNDKKYLAKDFVLLYGRMTFNVYTSEGYFIDTIRCDNFKDKENMNIYFGNYSYEDQLSFSFSTKTKLTVIAQTSLVYKDGQSIIFYIKNGDSSKITLDFSDTKLYTANNDTEGYKVISNPKFEIEPGVEKQFELKFEPIKERLTRIGMNVLINGKLVTSDSVISYRSAVDDD